MQQFVSTYGVADIRCIARVQLQGKFMVLAAMSVSFEMVQ